MKAGRTIQELAAEVQRQSETKADYIADTRRMSVHVAAESDAAAVGCAPGPNVLTIDGTGPDGSLGEFAITELCHDQIGGRLDIPSKFYDRLRVDHAELLAHNVNTLWRERPDTRLVRTLDGKARAFLSNRYRRLDNLDLIEAVVPTFAEVAGGAVVESCELTEKRLYIKALFPRIQAEVAVGDVVQAGVVISNSEVGAGALSVQPLLFRLVCLNGMIAADYGSRRNHVGKRVEEDEAMLALYRDETIAADDRAFWLKVQDLVRAAANEAQFAQIVAGCKELASLRLSGDGGPVATVERLGDRFGLGEDERGGVLHRLIEGADLSAWGLLNAVTRHAQDVESYDRSTELEQIGGRIAALPAAELKALVAA